MTDFRHLHAAHCESGATASLLSNRGLAISEAMAFGIGSGIFFFYAPFFKVMGLPLTSYRTYPGTIFKKTCRRLGVKWTHRTYRNPERAMRDLDALLEAGVAVGLQGGIYWLPYFPPQLRFQFNGHNLIAVGVDGSTYLISDPVLEEMVACPSDALVRARFSRGPLAPRGFMYFPVSVPDRPDFPTAILAGIRDTCRRMLDAPLPITGVRGIRYLSREIRRWPITLRDEWRAALYVANVVRMQEEVGTGGAGFRFMYAAFLQQAGALLQQDGLLRASEMFTANGDLWRDFAAAGAQVCKQRGANGVDYATLAEILAECADREETAFRYLRGWVAGAN